LCFLWERSCGAVFVTRVGCLMWIQKSDNNTAMKFTDGASLHNGHDENKQSKKHRQSRQRNYWKALHKTRCKWYENSCRDWPIVWYRVNTYQFSLSFCLINYHRIARISICVYLMNTCLSNSIRACVSHRVSSSWSEITAVLSA
jgi:hypothetical protein